ncbi:MAG: hypothetical protein J0M08_12285, partial [Bacteroidetes bacterium]|nr:hypothetical protein [Bacteroidota bacterium]
MEAICKNLAIVSIMALAGINASTAQSKIEHVTAIGGSQSNITYVDSDIDTLTNTTYLLAYVKGTCDIDPSSAKKMISEVNNPNHDGNNQSLGLAVVIAYEEINSKQKLKWVSSLKSIGNSMTKLQKITFDYKNKNIFVAGHHDGKFQLQTPAGATSTINAGSAGGTDIFLLKYDVLGNLVKKAILQDNKDNGVSSRIKIAGLATDKYGNLILLGSLNQWGNWDINPGQGYGAVVGGLFLAKYDNNFAFKWSKNISYDTQFSSWEDITFDDMALDSNGNIIFSGRVIDDTYSGLQLFIKYFNFVSKYSTLGNQKFTNKILEGRSPLYCTTDKKGDVICYGTLEPNTTISPDPVSSSNKTIVGDNTAYNAYLVKYQSANGKLVWVNKVVHNSLAGDKNIAQDVTTGPGNSIITSTKRYNTGNMQQLVLEKYTSAGVKKWGTHTQMMNTTQSVIGAPKLVAY